jgi:hypothetical protein
VKSTSAGTPAPAPPKRKEKDPLLQKKHDPKPTLAKSATPNTKTQKQTNKEEQAITSPATAGRR